MTLHVMDWVAHHAMATPEKLAMRELPIGRAFTYAEMNTRVAQLAGVLKSHGIEKGDRVAFLTLNSTDTMEVIFACWRVGAVVLALNFRLTPPELKFIIDNAEAKMCIVDEPFAPIADALRGNCTVEHWLITNGMGGESPYETALAESTPIYDMVPQDMSDQCMLMYSSGTTGQPKGVIITHAMLSFTNMAGSIRAGTNGSHVALSNMPLFHIGGLNVTALPSIHAGGTTVIVRLFDPKGTLDAINNPELGITTLFMVPAAYDALRAHPDSQSTDFSRIEIALCGAAAVPPALVEYWLTRGLTVQEGYGMTETAAAGTMLSKEDIPAKVGSAGKALLYAEIKILDDNGRECAPNVPGEICYRGPSVTPGYWRRPDANKDSFINGWFKSGDVGRMDADGYLYIEDRKKDMYISGGENVYPAEIENVIYAMDEIAEVAVIGVPDEKWGEVGCVCAVVNAGAALDLEKIQAYCADKLAKYKCPHYFHVLAVLPRTATGKVQKFELRETVTPIVCG